MFLLETNPYKTIQYIDWALAKLVKQTQYIRIVLLEIRICSTAFKIDPARQLGGREETREPEDTGRTPLWNAAAVPRQSSYVVTPADDQRRPGTDGRRMKWGESRKWDHSSNEVLPSQYTLMQIKIILICITVYCDKLFVCTYGKRRQWT